MDVKDVDTVKTLLELRIPENAASAVLAPDEGQTLNGAVRKLCIDISDHRVEELRQLHLRWIREYDKSLFLYWNLHHRYTTGEIDNAELFHLRFKSIFEPEGEACGTIYDESIGCPICGASREQKSPLRLNLRKVPKRADLACTIADERIVSQRFVDLYNQEQFTGATFCPVEHIGRRPPDLPWYQLDIVSPRVKSGPRTQFGIDPIEGSGNANTLSYHGGTFQCVAHVPGLNLISDLHIQRDSWDGSDFVCTHEQVGWKQGVLRPTPLVLVSARLRSALIGEDLLGWETDVAWLE